MAKETSRRVADDSPKSAANFIRRSSQAVRARREGVGAHRSERLALIEWAELLGKRLPFSHVEKFRRVAEGAEHVVFHDLERALAVKATHVNRFGHSVYGEGAQATPVEYLRRLGWHNLLFGDDIRIEGVAFDEEQIQVFTSQPWITAHREFPLPAQTEIDEFFAQIGFRKFMFAPDVPLYFRPEMGLLVADAHDRNVLRSESGRLVPIDVVIGKPGPDLLRRILAQLRTTEG